MMPLPMNEGWRRSCAAFAIGGPVLLICKHYWHRPTSVN
jgi:hypothetical protein